MRKISSLTLALGFLMPLAGCPGDDSGNDDSNVATTAPTTSVGTTEGTAEDTATPETQGNDETATPPSGGFCVHQCTGDGDCTIGGRDAGLTCVDNFCTGEAQPGCTNDDECIAQLSGWSFGTPCTAGGGECDVAMQICLDVGGEGHCVTGPTEFLDCATLMQDEINTTDIDGADVVVCGNSNAACNDSGACFSPCASDDDCTVSAFPVCNTDSGLCECGEDAHCATLENAALSVCNGGSCGCGEDQNCVDGEVGDVCNQGACGCSGDMACEGVTNSFDGGMISCVEL